MDDVTLLVGNVAVVCTVANNFAGLPVCLDVAKRRSTSGVSPLPFFTAACCTCLWLQYGAAVGDRVVMSVNLVSVFMQAAYLFCFYRFCGEGKVALKRWMVWAAVTLTAVHTYSFYVAEREAGARILGLLSSCGSILTSAAPLSEIREVFRSGSTVRLPFLIIFSTFVVTVLWCIYGVLIDDAFVKIPNFVAALLSGFQLTLFAVFDSKENKD